MFGCVSAGGDGSHVHYNHVLTDLYLIHTIQTIYDYIFHKMVKFASIKQSNSNKDFEFCV